MILWYLETAGLIGISILIAWVCRKFRTGTRDLESIDFWTGEPLLEPGGETDRPSSADQSANREHRKGIDLDVHTSHSGRPV